MKTIAILGGGFSGTIAAVNLARFAQMPLRIFVVNHKFPWGRGVAYSTRRPEHLLNVAARNMSALADRPNHFVQWLATRSEFADVAESVLRETFVPRRVYGDYLRSLFLWHCGQTEDRPGLQVELIEDEAIDVLAAESGATIVLASGRRLEADRVLLATGNQPPAGIASATPGEAFQHPNYCDSSWVDWTSRLPDRHETVVLLGTGLTTVDAVLTLTALEWQGPIVAVSRNGLLPLSHFRGIEYPEFPPENAASLGLAALVELVEEHCARLKSRGANPAIAVDRLRPYTQRIWQNFSLAEKREFCRRYAARWNVTRHRIAEQIHECVRQALASGQLRIVQGSVQHLTAADGRVGVTIQRPTGEAQTITGGLVINCTGPQASFSACQAPLVQNLLASGLISADEMDMGIQADADFAVIDGRGQRSDFLFAMGPLLKGTLWETIAVPELRGQALRVAQTLLDEVAAADRQPQMAWPTPAYAEILEYCI